MDEYAIYQGTHEGAVIDRDLGCIDMAFNASVLPMPNASTISQIPAVGNGPIPGGAEEPGPGNAEVYYVSDLEFDYSEISMRPVPTKSLPTYGLVKSANKNAMRKCVKVVIPNVSSLPLTRYSQDPAQVLNSSMEVIHSVLSNPGAQVGPWTVTTGFDSTLEVPTVTISGSITGTTDIVLYLATPYYDQFLS